MPPPQPWPHPDKPHPQQARRPGRHGFPKRLAKAILRRDQECQLRLHGCTIDATEADHIVSYYDAMAAGWTADEFDDPGNGQGVCSSCHANKTAIEAARGRQRGRERRKSRHEPSQHPGITGP